MHSSQRADSANPLYSNLALYDIDGNTGTRPWKVKKTQKYTLLIFVYEHAIW